MMFPPKSELFKVLGRRTPRFRVTFSGKKAFADLFQ